jgi:hypothetical protein
MEHLLPSMWEKQMEDAVFFNHVEIGALKIETRDGVKRLPAVA